MKTKHSDGWMAAVVAVACLALGVGCANFTTVQTDRRFDAEGKVTTEVSTRASARTFFAGKSALANWKATQSEESQGAEVGGLDQQVEGAGAEVSAIVQAVTSGVVSAMKP